MHRIGLVALVKKSHCMQHITGKKCRNMRVTNLTTFQSKTFKTITKSPWYVTNIILHKHPSYIFMITSMDLPAISSIRERGGCLICPSPHQSRDVEFHSVRSPRNKSQLVSGKVQTSLGHSLTPLDTVSLITTVHCFTVISRMWVKE